MGNFRVLIKYRGFVVRGKAWNLRRGNFYVISYFIFAHLVLSFAHFLHIITLWNIIHDIVVMLASINFHCNCVMVIVLNMSTVVYNFLVSPKADLICLAPMLYNWCWWCYCGWFFSRFRHKLRYGLCIKKNS
jgi:hypothetical protein